MNEALRNSAIHDQKEINSCKKRVDFIKEQRERLGIPESSIVYSSEEDELNEHIAMLEFDLLQSLCPLEKDD